MAPGTLLLPPGLFRETRKTCLGEKQVCGEGSEGEQGRQCKYICVTPYLLFIILNNTQIYS